MTPLLMLDDEREGGAGDVTADVEQMIADFCEEHGAETYEAAIEGLSGVAKADGQPLLKITVSVRPHKGAVH